ncbi:MAG: SufD family Fe-S cluster assembly protein [Bacilli bacterium]|jgi:Fe-S cluster assembly protein SufD
MLVLDDSSVDLNYEIAVGNGARLNLNIASFGGGKSLQISIILTEKATFCGAYADFSNGDHSCNIMVSLNDDYTSAEWHLSCLSSSSNKKLVNVSFDHIGKHTSSSMNNYGVACDSSTLVFKGVSSIKNGAAFSDAKQVSKIIVFNDDVVAESSPSLHIDENDVNASHSAIVGRLNEDHMFYLKSRGLSESEAKSLITYGYLSPVAMYFPKTYKAKIDSVLRERF